MPERPEERRVHALRLTVVGGPLLVAGCLLSAAMASTAVLAWLGVVLPRPIVDPLEDLGVELPNQDGAELTPVEVETGSESKQEALAAAPGDPDGRAGRRFAVLAALPRQAAAKRHVRGPASPGGGSDGPPGPAAAAPGPIAEGAPAAPAPPPAAAPAVAEPPSQGGPPSHAGPPAHAGPPSGRPPSTRPPAHAGPPPHAGPPAHAGPPGHAGPHN